MKKLVVLMVLATSLAACSRRNRAPRSVAWVALLSALPLQMTRWRELLLVVLSAPSPAR